MKKKFTAKIITLQDAYEACYQLADTIMRSPYSFEMVIAIARGGFPAGRFICDFLNIRSLSSLQITHYESGAVQKEKAEIICTIGTEVKGKRILLIDDVNDSGKTLQAAVNYIQSLQPALLKTAVLHEKQTTIFKADFSGVKVIEWKWLMYQWAVTEDVLAFLKKDNMLEENEETVQAHLVEKYGLKIDKEYLHNILKMKDNYF